MKKTGIYKIIMLVIDMINDPTVEFFIIDIYRIDILCVYLVSKHSAL